MTLELRLRAKQLRVLSVVKLGVDMGAGLLPNSEVDRLLGAVVYSACMFAFGA